MSSRFRLVEPWIHKSQMDVEIIKHPSENEQIRKMCYLLAVVYYSVLKK
jgi:hypothetical protein